MKCILLANGQAPSKSVFKFLQRNDYKTFICADGGANSAFKLNLIPDFIIGDLDSVRDDVLDFYKNKSVKIKRVKRQNDTDVEKCLKFAVEKGFEEVVLLGATGDRLDHSFCNLGIVLKFFDQIKIKIIHQKSILTAYKKQVSIKTVPGETFSMYGFNYKTKITTDGLKYPLNNEPLPFGVRESTSNVAIGEEVNLKIKNGIIFVIREFDKLKKNGLFQFT